MKRITFSEKHNVTYKVGNILLAIDSGKSPNKYNSDHLQEVKNAFDEIFKNNETYYSKITTVNGNPVLVRQHTVRSIGFYNMILLNKSMNCSVSCSLIFNKKDFEKASVLSEEVLQNIVFLR